MNVINKFMDYRATQEHKLVHGVDGRQLELGDVNTINLTMLNVTRLMLLVRFLPN